MIFTLFREMRTLVRTVSLISHKSIPAINTGAIRFASVRISLRRTSYGSFRGKLEWLLESDLTKGSKNRDKQECNKDNEQK